MEQESHQLSKKKEFILAEKCLQNHHMTDANFSSANKIVCRLFPDVGAASWCVVKFCCGIFFFVRGKISSLD